MEGRTLYLETFDPKGPFIFLFYGIGYLTSNTSFIALYILFAIGLSLFVVLYITFDIVMSKNESKEK